MTDSTPEATAINATEQLLAYYNFQDEVQSREQLLDSWLRSYPLDWVRLALIEALDQGRYKSASVEYLLRLWQRRGQPTPHFSREFERLVSHNCPKTFLSLLQIPREAEAEQNNDLLSTFIDELLLPNATSSVREAPAQYSLGAWAVEDGDFPVTSLEAESSSVLTEFSSSEPVMTSVTALDELDALEQQLTGEVSSTESLAVRVNATTPIHRFKPSSRPSELYIKLAAMANQA
jgi:hypothetical protein